MSHDLVSLAHRFFEEVWNKRQSDTIDELIFADSVCHCDSDSLKGAEEFRSRVYQPFIAAFPDLKFTIEDILAGENRVAVRWLATGTHTGDGLGIPATGKTVAFRGTTWIRFEGDKMMEGWDCWDRIGLIESLKGGG